MTHRRPAIALLLLAAVAACLPEPNPQRPSERASLGEATYPVLHTTIAESGERRAETLAALERSHLASGNAGAGRHALAALAQEPDGTSSVAGSVLDLAARTLGGPAEPSMCGAVDAAMLRADLLDTRGLEDDPALGRPIERADLERIVRDAAGFLRDEQGGLRAIVRPIGQRAS
jgi:hypothetical protein